MLCSLIKNDLLNPLLQITINGPKQDSNELPTLMQEVVLEWLNKKDRGKLQSLPISTVTSTSVPGITNQLTPEVVAVEDDLPHQVHTEEQDQEDQVMPSSLDPDPCSSRLESAQEPNFDAYVAALQLQDCNDDQSNMEDSDYESDYFSH